MNEFGSVSQHPRNKNRTDAEQGMVTHPSINPVPRKTRRLLPGVCSKFRLTWVWIKIERYRC